MVRNNNLGDMGLSSLHLLKNGTFIHTKNGCFCQFSTTNCQELFKYKNEGEFVGFATISSSDGGSIIANNYSDEISIFKVHTIVKITYD